MEEGLQTSAIEKYFVITPEIRLEWGEWMRESLILDVPHRQVVFALPKMLL